MPREYPAERERVHPYAVGCEVRGERPGEIVDARLRRYIGDGAEFASRVNAVIRPDRAVDGRNVHDHSRSRFHHVGRDRPHDQK